MWVDWLCFFVDTKHCLCKSVVSHVAPCVTEEWLPEVCPVPCRKGHFYDIWETPEPGKSFSCRGEAEEDWHFQKQETVIYSPSSAHLTVESTNQSTFWWLLISFPEHQVITSVRALELLWSDALFGQVAVACGGSGALRLCLSLECPQNMGVLPPLAPQVKGLFKLDIMSRLLPKNVRATSKAQITCMKKGSTEFVKPSGTAMCSWPWGCLLVGCQTPCFAKSSGCFVKASDVETNQAVPWEPPPRPVPLLSPVTWVPLFPKARGEHEPLLCPSSQCPSQESWP